MRRTFHVNYALAASVAALVIAAPVAFHVLQQPLRGLSKDAEPDFSSARQKPADLTEPSRRETAEGNRPATLAAPKTGEDKSAALTTTGDRSKQDQDAAGASTRQDAMDGVGRKVADEKTRAAGQSTAQSAVPAPPPASEPTAAYRRESSSRIAEPAKPELRKNKAEESGASGVVLGGEVDSKKSNESLVATLPLAVGPAQPKDGFGAVGGRLNAPGTFRDALKAAAPVSSIDERRQLQSNLQHYDQDQIIVQPQENRDRFETKENNPVKRVAEEPVSTFSIDVDTASYSFVRRALNSGALPQKAAVRVEELINYFPYAYPKPESAEVPFKPTITVMPSPWNAGNQLVHVAIKGYDIQSAERPRANLVFLMDVSGSMQPADRLPLVKNAFRMLVDELKPDDTVAIVTYASGSGICLEPTKVSDKAKIIAAIDRLGAGGSTAGAQGIQDAYRLAESNFDKAAVNRVILATDGDFNVGITDQDELKGFIERKRDKGIFLSILGVGQGNYNDALMQALAQNGNGTAAYADTLNEARKVLVDESSSTLFTIAKDVKIQLEFNPQRVSEYRLIGYETRALKREDFNNDRVDAGDIGSGHTVTAIYEVTPVGAAPGLVDDLRYAAPDRTRREPAATGSPDAEFGFLKLRYKLPKEDASKLVTLVINDTLVARSIDAAPAEARFSVAVAAFGQLLKGSAHLKSFGYDDVIELAQSAKGDDRFGYRAEFVNLVRLAKSARP